MRDHKLQVICLLAACRLWSEPLCIALLPMHSLSTNAQLSRAPASLLPCPAQRLGSDRTPDPPQPESAVTRIHGCQQRRCHWCVRALRASDTGASCASQHVPIPFEAYVSASLRDADCLRLGAQQP